MIFLRSLLYQIFFLPWTFLVCVVGMPIMAMLPRRRVQIAAVIWLEGTLWLQSHILRLSYEIRGRENLPGPGVMIAAKHQSAWDTMVFHRLLGDPAFVLKEELLALPLIGWYMRKTGQIAIDRTAGINALKTMLDGARQAISEGRTLVIFPEGHRQAPGETGRYHTGIALLYSALAVPVVPIALNSGMFWPRNAFLRRPGHIILQILPPIAPGLPRGQFMRDLQERIESATRALEAEARG